MIKYRGSASGTVLIFLLATMTIVTVMLSSMTKMGQAPGQLSPIRELSTMANAMAYSGIDIMASIGDISPTAVANTQTADGINFLRRRERYLTPGTAFEITTTFPLGTALNVLRYTPPCEYPPLKDLCVGVSPTNIPPNVVDNDIRLPNSNMSLYPTNWAVVPGTTQYGYSGVLPTETSIPPVTDINYTPTATQGLVARPFSNGYHIVAIQPGDVTASGVAPALPWVGPENYSSTLPLPQRLTSSPPYLPDPRVIQPGPAGPYTASEKFPTPSFIIPRDVEIQGTAPSHMRVYLYAWYLRSENASGTVWYYMTSGRVRLVYGTGATQILGPELMCSNTQLR